MIICQNCGTTNNENVNRVCRTCGALLPVPTKHHRPMDQKTEKEKKKEKKKTEKPPKVSIETEKKQEEKLDLHEIPKESEMLENQMNLQETPPLRLAFHQRPRKKLQPYIESRALFHREV